MDFFAPIVPSFFLLYLYSVSSAMNATAMGVTIYSDTVDLKTLSTYYLACLIGLCSLGFGFIWGKSKGIPPGIPVSERISDRQTFRKFMIYGVIIFLALFSYAQMPFDFINVKSYGEVAFASRMDRMDQVFAPIIDVFLINLPVTLMLCLATLLIFRRKNLFARSIGAAIYFCYIATALLGGGRSAVALAGILFMCFFNYRVKRIGLRSVLLIFLLGYFTINIMSVLRVTNDPQAMVEVFTETVHGNFDFLDLKNSGELLVGQNLMRLISGIQNKETDYSYGITVFTEFLTYIPRALYPGRPLPLSERFIDTFYNGVRETGAGYGFFYLMEGYWAFGLVGVFIFMLCYSRLVQWVYMFCLSNMRADFVTLWYAYLLQTLVFTAVRSGLIGVFKAALMISIPFILIYAAPNIRWKNISLRATH